MVRDYIPISCCKTISKVMTNRLGSLFSNIINKRQVVFVPGQHIHDHILLAYKLIKGYSSKGGAPRYLLQMDLQKAHDTVELSVLEIIL